MYISTAERDRRYRLAREAMAKENIDVLIVMGNTNSTYTAQWSTGNFRYLTDFYIFSGYGVLLFFKNEDPIMLIPMELIESRAKRFSWVEDIRISLNYPETIAEILNAKGFAEAKVGIVSMESTPSTFYISLKERLSKAQLTDASSILLPIRFTKSDEERNLMAQSAKLNDIAYSEVIKKIQPGMTEHEIISLLEGSHRMNGADKTFNIISSGFFPISNEGISFQGLPWCPTDRKIQKGDCILLEMTNAYGGYWNQLVRMVCVGRENQDLLKFQKAAVMSLKEGLDKLQTGMKTSELFSIMSKPAAENGFKLTTPMGHFVGLDLVEARVDAQSQVVFSPGLTFILHPNIADSNNVRILWGQTYYMTADGPISFNSTDLDTVYVI